MRDETEEHRPATTLELFFDLTIVVAVGRVATALDHELEAGHLADGILGFATMFFGIWWAWMNFTWFATAHDSDDVAYRLLTFVQITGALVFASGVTRAVEDRWLVVGVIGYVIMRAGLILNWLRVARDQPSVRPRALRYAGLIFLAQVLWVTTLALPRDGQLVAFIVLAVFEMSIPIIAERAAVAPFHAGHIEERYGLFTIIVLGESILSGAAGFQDAVDSDGLTPSLFTIGVAAVAIAFAAWWLYFDHPGHLAPTHGNAFRWGYLHVFVFAALAALGAGLHLAISATTEHGEASNRVAALAVAIPVACYLVSLVVVMSVAGRRLTPVRIWPKLLGAATAVVIGLVSSVPVTVAGCAVVMVVLAGSMVLSDPASRAHADA